jgi:hypothetical protein
MVAPNRKIWNSDIMNPTTLDPGAHLSSSVEVKIARNFIPAPKMGLLLHGIERYEKD